MQRALPFILFVSFLAFPVVSTEAFRAFLSDQVGDTAYLKADYSVKVGSDEAATIKLWAIVAILCYPIGVPFAYACLLYKVRQKLMKRERSSLCDALSFLHSPFKPAFL